ncbi:MAG: hypothetical protein JJU36_09750 [Phycisphaeraceae bacterium]|nr:hypothetical protein [Phycisphaeraceae bacterium]
MERINVTIGLAAILLLGVVADAAATRRTDSPPPEPDPAAFHRSVMANPNLRTSGTGEGFAWHAAHSAELFLDAFEAWGNPQWLEQAARYYDFYLEKLQRDPDGYEGWIGDPIGQRDATLKADALVGDALLCKPLARFAWLVLKQHPELEPRFGETARRYLQLSKRIVWEKWNHRGCYYEDRSGWGSYRTHGKLVDPRTGRWVDRPNRIISDNLNKHYHATDVLLYLWMITGREAYRDRILSVAGRAKTMWRYFPSENRIAWNFWMPHGPHDIEGRSPRGWVGVHPDRAGYQASEVAMWVRLYDAGLVFSEEDIRLLVNTNRWMMPTDGRTAWRSSDGSSNAGTLWTSLARFDPEIRRRYEQGLRNSDSAANRIRLAYLRRLGEPQRSFDRRWATDPETWKLVDVPLQPGRNLSMTVVIPDTVELKADRRVRLACLARVPGTLVIELLTGDGEQVLGELARIPVEGRNEYHAPFFDGTHPATAKRQPGQYQIRWTLDGEQRTQQVYIIEGEVPDEARPEELARGRTIRQDFEGDLDDRWVLRNARVSDERARSGRRSLRVDGGAELRFGGRDDLPVRVSMWIWDADRKLGEASHNGVAWGVTTALGDRFAIRQVWRPYLAGDRDYAWINTGENQWFSPRSTGIARRAGWSHWVMDFSDPANPEITGNGRAAARLVERFTPTGAVGIFLIGDPRTGPLYIDDLVIEYRR